ncbi:MAG: CvpA family protein [Holosporales bacterium]|jgi:membrane protein required for colicin V production|nr:CvpA family protein [Holosporales bacterium]
MEQFSHVTIDTFVGFCVFISFVIGWIRGATREIFSVISWIGGTYLTILFFPHVKGIARSYISHGLIADFVTSCVLFIVFLTLLSLLNYFFSNCVKKSGLNTTDKALGGIFGIVRAAVLLAALDIVLLQYIWMDTPDCVKRSNSHPIISAVSNFVILILPDKLQDMIVSHLSTLKRESLMNFVTDKVISRLDDAAKEDLIQNDKENKIIAENEQETEENIESINLDIQNIPPDKDNAKSEPQTAKNLATLKPKKNTDDNKPIEAKEKSAISGRRVRMDMDRILEQAVDDQ